MRVHGLREHLRMDPEEPILARNHQATANRHPSAAEATADKLHGGTGSSAGQLYPEPVCGTPDDPCLKLRPGSSQRGEIQLDPPGWLVRTTCRRVFHQNGGQSVLQRFNARGTG